MQYHSPWIIQDVTHEIVDALLTLISRQVLWPYHDRICTERLPIRWLWTYAVAEPLEYTWYNTQKRWHSVDTWLTLCSCSVDAHFQTGAVTISWLLLPRTDANTLIMGTCHSRALGLYMIQHPKSLTLCWQSVDAVLMPCWQSVDALLMLSLRCSSIDTHDITYKGCQYFDYG